ncbi:MAG: hypothetical protein IT361_07180 [Gemmatimonadaceae bacterium]|nr:hypothetical protein [Gemmatimonadaceae bacterium]
MVNYRQEIVRSWVKAEPSARSLAGLLGMATPVTLRAIVTRLHQVETVSVGTAVHTDDSAPINGHVAFELRSNGTYVFTGHMRATGFPSYHFGMQAWVVSGDGTVVAAQERGRVFGTDTPGPRQKDWSQAGVNAGLTEHWRSLRSGAGIGRRLDANITGVLGGAVDVLTFAVKGIVANVFLGPYGWVVLIGNELAGMDAQLASPDILAGILVGGATLLVVGPFGLVPAIVAGAATVAVANVKHRAMHPSERAFADRVFKGRIDYDRVVITNLTHSNGRKFTIPSIGNSILVNMGDEAFDNPTTYQGAANSSYPEPGSVFIHELTHAWQISHGSIVDMICGLSSNYTYFSGSNRLMDTAWPRRSWGGFNNEQQAAIVDDWYGAHVANLDGFDALNDPAFHFIRDNIRAGIL